MSLSHEEVLKLSTRLDMNEKKLKKLSTRIDNVEKRLKKQSDNDLTITITDYLLKLGIFSNHLNFYCLRSAISELVKDYSQVFHLMKLYEKIAKEHNLSISSVERNIRYAIEVSILQGDPELWNKLFACTIRSPKGKPTVGEFIATIADQIRLNQ